MRRCDAHDHHKVTPIYWMVREQYRAAQTFMCEYCLRMFDITEISNRHENLKKIESAQNED
jgi:hypothetical protein